MIESDLYHYFASIGINEQQQRQAVTGVFDTADIDTIQKLCQKEKMHLRYESIGKNESKEITKLTYEQLCNSLKKGIYQVAFSIYRQGKDWQSLSMADQGFEKPAYLHLKGDKNYLELAVREMKAMTKGGGGRNPSLLFVHCAKVRFRFGNRMQIYDKMQLSSQKFTFCGTKKYINVAKSRPKCVRSGGKMYRGCVSGFRRSPETSGGRFRRAPPASGGPDNAPRRAAGCGISPRRVWNVSTFFLRIFVPSFR